MKPPLVVLTSFGRSHLRSMSLASLRVIIPRNGPTTLVLLGYTQLGQWTTCTGLRAIDVECDSLPLTCFRFRLLELQHATHRTVVLIRLLVIHEARFVQLLRLRILG